MRTCAVTLDWLAHGNYRLHLHPVIPKTAVYESRLKNQSFFGGSGSCVEQHQCVSRPVHSTHSENETRNLISL